MLNRGLLITHRQLLVEVWGPQHADATPLLRTHIANLRGKLGGGERRRSLSAPTPAIGYRFRAADAGRSAGPRRRAAETAQPAAILMKS